MDVILGISIILLLLACALYLVREIWRTTNTICLTARQEIMKQMQLSPEERAERNALARKQKLIADQAWLQRYKESQRRTYFDVGESFNPATGLPMLTDTMDIGGNDASVIGGI